MQHTQNDTLHGPKPVCKISIIGAGLAGLSTAIALAQSGHEVTVLERMPVLTEIGAGIQLPPNSTKLLREWGLLDQIEELSFEPGQSFVRSYRDGAVLSTQSFDEVKDLYSVPYLVIHRADLHSVLLQHAKDLGVSVRLNCDLKASDINFSETSIFLANHGTIEADIILGADGERSVCRDALIGYEDPLSSTGDMVFRFTVKTSDILQQGLTDLIDPPNINFWMGPNSHVVSYVMKKDGLLNVVLTTPSKPGAIHYGIQKASTEELKAAFDQWDPKTLGRLLNLAQNSNKWMLLQSNRIDQWVHPGGNFALIGDSAHAMLPYLAQGAAQAFEDAAVLGALFGKLTHKSQLPEILQIYENLRKPRAFQVRQRSSELRGVWGMPDGPLQEERDRQLKLPPFEGSPNFLSDPVFQKWLWGYDVAREAKKAWKLR